MWEQSGEKQRMSRWLAFKLGEKMSKEGTFFQYNCLKKVKNKCNEAISIQNSSMMGKNTQEESQHNISTGFIQDTNQLILLAVDVLLLSRKHCC